MVAVIIIESDSGGDELRPSMLLLPIDTDEKEGDLMKRVKVSKRKIGWYVIKWIQYYIMYIYYMSLFIFCLFL